MKFIERRKKLISLSALLLAILLVVWSCTKDENNPIVLLPTISNVTPTSGEIGDEVTITGTNFNTAAIYNEVKIGGVGTLATSVTPTSLTANVPVGAKSGTVDLVVKAYGVTTDALDFTVIWPPPVLANCVPGYGYSDDTITLNGLNFSSDLADISVSFGTTDVTAIESTATSISVLVPAGAATSEATVTIAGQTSNTVTFFVPVNPATVEYLIDNTDDDVEESVTRGDGAVETASADLELGMFDTGYTPDYGKSIVGVRHHDIAIPQGATIISAHLQFMADDSGSDPCQVTIYGEDAGNAAIFEEIAFNVSSRTITTASVVWDIPTWVDLDRGDAQKTPDLRAIIQEIVDRGDWVSGNAMSFQLHDSGPTADPQIDDPEGREADCGDEAKGPSLVIIYEL